MQPCVNILFQCCSHIYLCCSHIYVRAAATYIANAATYIGAAATYTVLNSTNEHLTQDGFYLTIHHSRDIILKMSIPPITDNHLTSSKFQFDHTDTNPNCVKWAPGDQVMFLWLWQGKDFCCFICPWSNQYPAWLECSFSGWYPDCDGWWGKVKSILRRRFSCHSTMGPL